MSLGIAVLRWLYFFKDLSLRGSKEQGFFFPHKKGLFWYGISSPGILKPLFFWGQEEWSELAN